VGNEEQNNSPGQTEGLPPEFAALQATLLGERVRVGKDQHGIFKAHAMLARV